MSDQIAIEISKENEAHVAENKILKKQNQNDELKRNNYEEQILGHNLTKDKIVETEKLNKQMEYRQFLLQQMEDKEKRNLCKSPEIQGHAYVYSEDLIAPGEKKNFKLMKQQEMKNGLDECIRMKNALKLENKQKEIEEESERMDFLEKRETDTVNIREQARHKTEDNELRKEEAAKQWLLTNNKIDEREQFVNSLLEKDTTLSQLNNEVVENVEEIRVENDSLEHEEETTNNVEAKESFQNNTNEVNRQDNCEVVAQETSQEEIETI